MLSKYFGFKEEPFGASPNPRCLFPSHTHNEALASLKYGFLNNRGFTAMISPPGLGKTTLILRFLEEIRESSRSVFLFDIDSDCEPRDFISYILRDIGIVPAQTSSEMHEQLSKALVEETQAERKFVVVIDEAQSLSDAVLERVRLLTNFETSNGKLLQIVLSGQPELSTKLMRASLVQLRQRVSTICHIEPLSPKETVAYIDYRLRLAGYDEGGLFDEDALQLISEYSQGTPRIINNLCFNSLSICRALNARQVNGSMVSEVIDDLQLISRSSGQVASAVAGDDERHPGSKSAPRTRRRYLRWALTSVALLILFVLILFGFQEFRSRQARRLDNADSQNYHIAPPSVPETSGTSFEVSLATNQTLYDLSVKYLGGFSQDRLRKILELNPTITDPRLILAGQKIRLPGSPRSPAINSTTSPPQSGQSHEP